MKHTFIVLGKPIAKQRPRARVLGGHAHIYSSEENITYEAKVYQSYINSVKSEDKQLFTDRMIFITINAYFSLTKVDYGKTGLSKSGRQKIAQKYCSCHNGDLDNVAKSILDALNGVAFKDDSQVVGLVAFKYWSQDKEQCEITIEDAPICEDILY